MGHNQIELAGCEVGHREQGELTALEAHRVAAAWFQDAEIFDFVADHVHLMAQYSLRPYRQAWELKQAGR